MSDDCEVCCICLDEFKTYEPCVQLSCNHVFHTNCLQRYLLREDLGRCPLCRKTFFNTEPSLHPKSQNDFTKTIKHREGHLGLTLKSVSFGVEITKLDKNDLAFKSGLRCGQVITHMNGIRCLGHKHAIHLLTAAFEHSCDVVCTLNTQNTKSVFRRSFCALTSMKLHRASARASVLFDASV